jgi:exodeoxyribonuclease V alpha subunit
MSDILRGTVERITYHNEENGYTVAQLMPEGQSYTVTVVGNMLGINVGEAVAIEGAWTAHAQYGRQFRADNVRTVLPATIAGLEKYLGSGLIKGVGPVTAHRIVRKFGLDTLKVIEEEPSRLHEVLGVGPKRVKIITKAWEEQRQIKEVMLFLQSHNVSTGLAVKIYKAYGDNAIEIVKSDPYRLAREVYGIGFITADKIARELGIAHDAPERVAAGVAYVLSQAADEGNVYLPAEELAKQAGELLEVTAEQAMQGIGTLAEAEEVRVEGGAPPGRAPAPAALASTSTAGNGETPVNASTLRRGPAAPPVPSQQPSNPVLAEERAVYLTPFYYGEIGVANRLRRLAAATEDGLQVFQNFDWPAAFGALQANTKFALTAQQQEAVQAALTHRVAVLTGGPGTGKTTTVRSVIRLAEAAGKRALLASPTGRAAKRLAEASGRQAKTVHRLLEYKPGEGVSFQRNEENPLETDILILDEASMLDLLLTNNLLKAIPAGAHLLLVGDVDQLPSVGAGNVLRDVIEAIEGKQGDGSTTGMRGAAVVRLNTIFRQPEGSYIISNAHRINHGQMPVIDNQKSQDFFLFKEEDPERAAALIVELVGERIPRKFALTPDQIQVLSPMHRGEVGVAQLNLKLQAALNPPGPAIVERQVGGRAFRAGDRVMQIRNNYDKDVYNGDMGRVEKIDLEDQVVTVRIDDRPIGYDFLELDELAHSYAVSIHKAQGSEFPAVVIPLLTTHYVMLQRNLLYTAVTRAQRLVVIVGTTRAIGIAVTSNRAQARYSGLAERLEAENKATGTRRSQVVL